MGKVNKSCQRMQLLVPCAAEETILSFPTKRICLGDDGEFAVVSGGRSLGEKRKAAEAKPGSLASKLNRKRLGKARKLASINMKALPFSLQNAIKNKEMKEVDPEKACARLKVPSSNQHARILSKMALLRQSQESIIQRLLEFGIDTKLPEFFDNESAVQELSLIHI
eukprot:TRINITY_DN3751_c0_g2_i1.p1 TRINITY_DN3751_c0_g2~~TRINITY_DN3751_c0_g2_i1.p1  ORF type:complete len:167 (-),score=17.50 TRINITY_DN3751_c0_g2_i1:65-565(-)